VICVVIMRALYLTKCYINKGVNYVCLQHLNPTPLSPMIAQLHTPESNLFFSHFAFIYFDDIACLHVYCCCTNHSVLGHTPHTV
jgi:hypothetical protein